MLIRIRKIYMKMMHHGESKNTVMDTVCAAALALCPILQYYIGPIQNAGFTILILTLPWITFRFINQWNSEGIALRHLTCIVGLILFLIYRSFIHEVSLKSILYNTALIILFVAALYGSINIKHFLMASSIIAVMASVLVMVQTCCYYLLRHHLQLVPTELFTENASAWILLAKTGTIGVTQRVGHLYRPSAFFMEPSHMFLYTFPHLLIVLLSPGISRSRLWMAIIYSAGLVLCTSGMGIVIAGGAWALFFSMSSGSENKLSLKNVFRRNNFFMIHVFLALGIIAIVAVPFVRESIKRFLDTSDSGAISGRTRLSNMLLQSLTGKKLLLGVTSTMDGLSFNMSGFAATLYKFGIAGLVLSYWTYLFGVFKLKGAFFWISLTIVAVSFFSAHTHGTFYMIYYIFILLEGWNQRNREAVSSNLPYIIKPIEVR